MSPTLWQPPSGIFMTNDTTDNNPEEAVHCFALSKNDSYVMSASGGKISLFNMMTFKVGTSFDTISFFSCRNKLWSLYLLQTMTTFMPAPPAATFLAFHPQDNNIIAIGMDDSTIQIYNVRIDEVFTVAFVFLSIEQGTVKICLICSLYRSKASSEVTLRESRVLPFQMC